MTSHDIICSQCLKSLSVREAITSDSPPSPVNPDLADAQYQLAQAWRTLLLVAASCQVEACVVLGDWEADLGVRYQYPALLPRNQSSSCQIPLSELLF